ncbi:alkaline phosphatase [Paraglaciecola sp. L3A3]|uniref:alkaline phosphatase D family protein n=1 Tax=Paraglaciecola sp. L3A3 TaxID=2686358 RepID=UPI00131CE0CC|nr:alkaline phosphatase D family protein [Paraglaciecola sp. L3A3]
MNLITRRSFLVGTSASVFAVAANGTNQQDQASQLFAHGVASGDPTHNSVIIWTRLSVLFSTNVSWQVALDDNFKQIVKSGTKLATANSDFTIKVDVTGLKPGQTYFYRFSLDNFHSLTGRTKTLSQQGMDKLTFAVVSCSNFPFGYFNAYEHIAEDSEIDFVLHLGDFMYEYSQKSWGGVSGQLLNREHLPANETITLADYRTRHAQYKTDQGSKLMHAAHPLIPTWDDHESTNNPYLHGAQNHQVNEGDWYTRRDASLQAYYEWMPIRDPKKVNDRAKLWRHFQFGNLASLITLETRHTGRSKQVDYSDHLPNITNQQARDKFVREQLHNPAQTILHPEMEEFLSNKLTQSISNQEPWRLIGNQIPMAKINMPDITDHVDISHPNFSKKTKAKVAKAQQMGNWKLPISLDTWNGYAAAREKFYNQCMNVKADDLLVFTGDSHCFWANQLHTQQGKNMGFEIGTTSVTSPGSFDYFAEYARTFDALLSEQNAEVLWADCEHRGYVKTTLTKTQAKIDYIAMQTVTKRSTASFLQKSMTIQRTKQGLRHSI